MTFYMIYNNNIIVQYKYMLQCILINASVVSYF